GAGLSRDAAHRQLHQGGAHRGVGPEAHWRRSARSPRPRAARAPRAGHARGDGPPDRRPLLRLAPQLAGSAAPRASLLSRPRAPHEGFAPPPVAPPSMTPYPPPSPPSP